MITYSSFGRRENKMTRSFWRKLAKGGSLIVGIGLLSSWLAFYSKSKKGGAVLGFNKSIAWSENMMVETLKDEPSREIEMKNGVKFFMPMSINDADLVGDRIAESEALAFRRGTLGIEFAYGPSNKCGCIKFLSKGNHFRLTKLNVSGVNASLGSDRYKSDEFEVTNSCLCIPLTKSKQLLVISYTTNENDLNTVTKIMKSITLP